MKGNIYYLFYLETLKTFIFWVQFYKTKNFTFISLQIGTNKQSTTKATKMIVVFNIMFLINSALLQGTKQIDISP